MNHKHKRSTFKNPAEFNSFFNVYNAHAFNASGRTAALKKLPIRFYWNSKINGTFIRHNRKANSQSSAMPLAGSTGNGMKKKQNATVNVYVERVRINLVRFIKQFITWILNLLAKRT